MERRRTPRIPVDFPVTVTWGRKQFRWPAREFSEFGILLAAGQQELVGKDVQIELTLAPKQPPLSLAGIVAYATEMGLGIRFKNVSPDHQATLKDYVQAHGIGIGKR